MEAYLDNSATTKIDPDVKDLVITCMEEDYGNAASLHEMGLRAEKRIKKAKEQIAETLKCSIGEIYFTSGGTESNNWALIGTAHAKKRQGKHIITTNVEHPSVKNVVNYLEEEGFEITRLEADENGIVSPEKVEEAIRPDTILVSVMAVNNEIGALEPIDEIGEIVRKKAPQAYFHVDAIQAYGKIVLHPHRENIDMLSVSGHKIHAPKGIGILYIGENVRIAPYIYGGGQQKGMRSGTENVPGSAGIGLAAEKLYSHIEEVRATLYARKALLTKGLQAMDGTHLNGKLFEESAPHIVSCSFQDVSAEVLLHALEEKGIYVSSGSACHSKSLNDKTTLDAIHVPDEFRKGTIRFSLCENTTEEEIQYTLKTLAEIVPELRRYTRR